MATVEFYEDDEVLCTVQCAVADDELSRYTGLSGYDSLEEGQGMLFLYEDEDVRSFVMRDMDFDLDIIYADKDGIVTQIHSAEAPDGNPSDRSLQEYTGVAQAVVEVPEGFARQCGIQADRTKLRLEIEEERE